MVHNLSFQQHPHALTIPRARQTCMRTLTVFCNKIDRVLSMVWDNPSTWEWLHFCVLLPLVSFKSFMLQQKNSIHFIIQDQPPLTLTRHPKLVYLSRRQKNVSLIKLRTSSDTARKQCLSLLLWTNCPHHPKQSLSWARLFCWLANPVYKVSELVIHCTRSSQLHSSLDSSSRRSATSTFISDVHWCLWGLWSRCGTQKTLPSYTWRCELHCLVRNGITKLTHLRLDTGRQVSNVSSIRLRTFSVDIYLREIISRIPQWTGGLLWPCQTLSIILLLIRWHRQMAVRSTAQETTAVLIQMLFEQHTRQRWRNESIGSSKALFWLLRILALCKTFVDFKPRSTGIPGFVTYSLVSFLIFLIPVVLMEIPLDRVRMAQLWIRAWSKLLLWVLFAICSMNRQLISHLDQDPETLFQLLSASVG